MEFRGVYWMPWLSGNSAWGLFRRVAPCDFSRVDFGCITGTQSAYRRPTYSGLYCYIAARAVRLQNTADAEQSASALALTSVLTTTP